MDDVRECLRAVADSCVLPDEVIVVDSSVDESTRDAVEGFAESAPPNLVVRYVHSEPGLTYQRNVGLAELDQAVDVVHFIDDDARVSRDYFREIISTFERDSAVVGVGGLVESTLPPESPSLLHALIRLHRRLFLLQPEPGRMTKAARVRVVSPPLAGDKDVEWLSGCAMSYRVSAIAGLRFDQELPGYGLGEDFDFSSRAGRRGRLVVNAQAGIRHLESPTNRLQLRAWIASDVVNRWHFVAARPEDFSRSAYLWSLVGMGVEFGLGLLGPSRRDAMSQLGGLKDGVRALTRHRARDRSL